ncbi:MAG: copper resistance protein CopB [Hydrogenophilales bacterium 28-61-11]|nr:MAG: copper resistance protein CopB [Hydrogenophilales bacterium 28-61-11]OYZ57386.1 MAG: copper resistance protein CopB [Hydrogenophilales bacterium 16-61-112]OZA49266.1 MAG: copper resistance protein CopB [Hydrogenophilales bacterium 17-61-76]
MSMLAIAITALGVSPVWGQTPDDAEMMDHALHQGAMPPATVKPNADQDAMPARDNSKMDHGSMDHGAMPGMKPEPSDVAGTMPDMNHDNQAAAQQDMSGMDHGDMQMQGGSAPANARDPHAYSGGYTLESGPYARTGPRELRMADEHNFGALRVDRLERGYTSDGNATAYDAQAWFGRDYNRLVIKAEGAVAQGKLQEARTELLWGHAIATFWDTQLGARYDSGVGPDRGWLAFGVQGLAPYWFEVDASAYVGNNGRTALRLGAAYELLLTQKLILQPRIEVNLYGKSDAARDIGSGLSDGAAGLRLRYEFTRQFAPYVGMERVSKFGQTADLARTANEITNETRWIAGVRFWF